MSDTLDTAHKVRVHIDGRPREITCPTTGPHLYSLAHVPEHELLYRERFGNHEDEPIPRDALHVVLTQDEHFYSAPPHKAEHEIIVNTRKKTIAGSKVSFAQVVKLAFPQGPQKPDTVYTVAYYNGPPRNPKGTMVEGETVKIKNEMVFDVTETSRS